MVILGWWEGKGQLEGLWLIGICKKAAPSSPFLPHLGQSHTPITFPSSWTWFYMIHNFFLPNGLWMLVTYSLNFYHLLAALFPPSPPLILFYSLSPSFPLLSPPFPSSFPPPSPPPSASPFSLTWSHLPFSYHFLKFYVFKFSFSTQYSLFKFFPFLTSTFSPPPHMHIFHE